MTYRSEVEDCDDFARAFQVYVNDVFGVNSVGVVIDYKALHAYNVCVTEDGSVYFIEPQNNKYVELSKDGYYILKKGIIIM